MKLAKISWLTTSVLLWTFELTMTQVDGKLGEKQSTTSTTTRDDNDKTYNTAEAFPRLQLREEKDRQLQSLTYYSSNPAARFIPLGICEGDCDEDSDCAAGLICFQRDRGGIPVPGCSGNDNARNDYCIRDPNQQPATPQPSPKPTPQPSNFPSPKPTTKPTSKPTTKPTSKPTAKPTTKPTTKPSPGPTSAPVNAPTPPPVPPPTHPAMPVPAAANIPVSLVGNNGRPELGFPLLQCQGDCDTDDECDVGLICFTRVSYQTVPGCLGGESDPRSADYCIVDPNPNPSPTMSKPPQASPTAPPPTVPLATLETMIVGNNGRPFGRFPLSLCQGDCDSDSECAEGLVCFDATPGAPVPGCLGLPSNGDYCIVDPGTAAPISYAATTLPTNKPTQQPTLNNSSKPTAKPTSKPTTKPTAKPTSKPSNSPTPNPTRRPTARPTPAPVTLKEIESVGRGNPNAYPLKLCQGDCDNDNDCEGTLICYQRDGGEEVPGCRGGLDDNSRTDYCAFPPTPNPTSYPTPNPTQYPTPNPTKNPTSKPTLAPTRQQTKAPSPNPTKRPTHMPVAWPTVRPTKDPTRTPTETPTKTPTATEAPTIGPTPLPTTAKPTQAPSPIPVPAPIHNIRLRLYWEEGYTWQESTTEKFWCMMADYRGKPGTGRCWHGQSTAPCARDQLYVADCNSDRRQRFSIMFVTHDQVMIKVARDNRCFQRNGQLIQLRACDPTNDLQRWFSRRGAFIQRRFELSNPTLPEYCATQEHHPKPGEQVYLEPCILARHPVHQTNFWTKF